MSDETEKPKRGAPMGSRNAAKDDGLEAVLRIRCDQADKGRWNRAAREAGMKLSEWARRRLNE
jgi:hypothetical protein